MLKNLRVPSCILDTKKNGNHLLLPTDWNVYWKRDNAFYLHAARSLCIFGAPLPDTTNSSISGLWTGLSGTIHPKTIGPRVEDSSCIKPPYSLGNGTGSGPAISRTYEMKLDKQIQKRNALSKVKASLQDDELYRALHRFQYPYFRSDISRKIHPSLRVVQTLLVREDPNIA
ncbi:hypothetical protein V1478_012712, partial [Vespula squamosa]